MTNPDTRDITQRLDVLRDKIDRAKTEKARAEANLEHAEAEIKKITETLRQEYGLAPEQLEGEIKRLDDEILALLDQAEEIIRGTELEGQDYD